MDVYHGEPVRVFTPPDEFVHFMFHPGELLSRTENGQLSLSWEGQQRFKELGLRVKDANLDVQSGMVES